jgi:hypothetical protein
VQSRPRAAPTLRRDRAGRLTILRRPHASLVTQCHFRLSPYGESPRG